MTLSKQEENKPLWNLINKTFKYICFAYHCPPVIHLALLIAQNMLSCQKAWSIIMTGRKPQTMITEVSSQILLPACRACDKSLWFSLLYLQVFTYDAWCHGLMVKDPGCWLQYCGFDLRWSDLETGELPKFQSYSITVAPWSETLNLGFLQEGSSCSSVVSHDEASAKWPVK